MENRTEVWTIQGANDNFNQASRASTANIPPPIANGTDKIFFNNPFLVGVQSKFRRKYYHKAVFAVLALIILVLIIAIICVAVKGRYSYEMCETTDCLRSASNLLLSMDQTVDPCDDFYQFTCGNWQEEHPRPDSSTSFDWFSEKQNKIIRKVRTFLQKNATKSDPNAVNKTKIMYKACMNVDAMNAAKFKPIFKLLKEFKLPMLPSILNHSDIVDTSSEQTEPFNWIETLVRIKLAMGMDVLIGFDIFPDPANRSINKIAVGTPESGSPLPFNDDRIRNKRIKKKLITDFLLNDLDNEDELSNPHDDDIEKLSSTSAPLKAYINYIRKVLVAFLVAIYPDIEIEDIYDTLTKVAVQSLRLTSKISRIAENAENITKSTHTNPLEDLLYLTTEKIENVTNELIAPKTIHIWDKYLPLIFQNYTNTKNQSLFNITTEKLLTSNGDVAYLQQIKQFIVETPKEQLEFFIWWFVVEELIVHTTSEMRQLHYEYTKYVIHTETTQPRSIYCTGGVNTLLGMAVSYTLIDQSFIDYTLPKMYNMLANIREAFNNLVKTTSWMDKETQTQTLDKSANMKSLIGFPEWIMNRTLLDDYYMAINVNGTKHLENMINILRWQFQKKFEDFEKPNKFGWATAPSNVNAFHTFQANTITIPIAILQYPFYELGLEALNYGAIGTILGHELTHGFDDSGRMFDKNGNMRQWWTAKTIKEYVNRTDCFIKQYGKYRMPGTDDNINGELTLGENIADNGGLREAYHAYQILRKKIGKEKYLPGLDSYTHDQLLFISFGNLWCETLTTSAAKYALEDSHCPGRIRLIGVLSNSPEFSEAFQCKIGSRMYPTDNRCRIW